MQSAIIRKLAELGHQAPSADNTQPWRMLWDGAALCVSYDSPRAAGKTFPPASPASLLAVGALIENVMSAAAAWGLQPRLELAEQPGSGSDALYARILLQLPGGAAAIPALEPVQRRHTNRGAYTAEAIPHPIASQLAQSTQGEARTWFSQDQPARLRLAHIVRQASEIRFQTREVHEWLGKSLRFGPAAVAGGDGLDVATLGLPPGGGALLRLISDWRRMRQLNRLGLYKLLAAIDSRPIEAGPGLLAIIAPNDTSSVIDAGRLLARQWGELNAAGLAVHPYYVVSDQLARRKEGLIPAGLEALAGTVASDCRQLLALSGEETLHMLLRVGFPKNSAKRSLRLPLETVYTDLG